MTSSKLTDSQIWLFTVATYFDVDYCRFARRYCYENPKMAAPQFDALEHQDSALAGWISTR